MIKNLPLSNLSTKLDSTAYKAIKLCIITLLFALHTGAVFGQTVTVTTAGCAAGTGLVNFDIIDGYGQFNIAVAGEGSIGAGSMADCCANVDFGPLLASGTYTYTVTDGNGQTIGSGSFFIDAACVGEGKCTSYDVLCVEEFNSVPDTDLIPSGPGCEDPGSGYPYAGTYILGMPGTPPWSPTPGWFEPLFTLEEPLQDGLTAPSGNYFIYNGFSATGEQCQDVTANTNGNGTAAEIACFEKMNVPPDDYSVFAFLASVTFTDPSPAAQCFQIRDANTNALLFDIPFTNVEQSAEWQLEEGLFTLAATTDLRICIVQKANVNVGIDIAMDQFSLASVDQFCMTADAAIVDCAANSSEVTFTVAGGAPPYTVAGYNGTTFPNEPFAIAADGSMEVVTGVATAGTYYYRITDANGCFYSGSIDIDEACAVPVELTYFNVESVDCKASLNWRTETELDNSHFEVERSLDAKTWTSIAKIEGAGTTVEPQEYSYIDAEVAKGTSYYRLKQVDFDGAYEYFDANLLHNKCGSEKGDMKISPVPVSTSSPLRVQYYVDNASEDTVLSIANIEGKIVKRVTRVSDTGWNTVNLGLSELSSGIYHIWDNQGNLQRLVISE